MDFLQANPALLAAAIFVARIGDVSLGTLRTILVFRRYRFYAAALGFVEVLVWLSAAAQVIRNLDVWYLALAYAGGFAAGNVVGIWLEGKLAVGLELVRAVSESREVELARHLREAGYHVIELAGFVKGVIPVEVLLIVEKRRRVPELLRRIQGADPQAVCTVTDVKREVPLSGPHPAVRHNLLGDLVTVLKRK